MWNSSERIGALVRRVKSKRWVVAGIVALAVPATVFSGLNAAEARKVKADTRGAETRAAQQTGHQVRCWQYGRLIFEENYLEAPPESPAYVLKLHGTEGVRGNAYLLDTRNATCLIKTGDAGRAPGK